MFDSSSYTIGWVCALRSELVAAIEHLDEEHNFNDYETAPNDNNTYIFGSIGKHNVVIATLPRGEYGVSSAASAARDMIRTFTNLRMGIMVGIGGGAPLMEPGEKQKRDIRLGDVVVSTPSNGNGGVLQYDYGKTIQGQQFKLTGHLNEPPQSILAAINVLGAEFERKGNALADDVAVLLEKNRKIQKIYQRPRPTTDRLYRSSSTYENMAKLEDYDAKEHIIQRDPRLENEDIVAVHDGLIASANQLMKDALIRDKLARESGVLCFEMEAGGLMNQFPFLVVRGICDYSDTHKNKEWQGYAAMTAAAYTRKLLLKLAPTKVIGENRLIELKYIKERLQNFDSDLNIVRSDLQQHISRSLRADVEKWLAAPDPEINFRSAEEQHEPGTGQWLMESEPYIKWKTGAIRHLWLHGKAGCGKSVISASIIKDIRSCYMDDDTNCAIFYFTFSDSSKQSYLDCLRSVVYQLSGIQSVSSALEELYIASQGKADGGLAVKESLENILSDGIRSYKRFFLVLDALDETPNIDSNNIRQREKLLVWLRTLSIKLSTLQILATSRRLPDIEAQMNTMDFHQESMTTGCVDVDISKYVVNQLSQDRRLCTLSADMKEKIQDVFKEKADGMFRWATCQMNNLRKLPSTRPSDLRKALEDLPASLDETYNRMINSIPSFMHKDALGLLRWLTYSRRLLSLTELSETRIISLDTDNGDVAFHDRGRAEDVIEILSGLISIDDEIIPPTELTYDLPNDDAMEDYDLIYSVRKARSEDMNSRRRVRLAHFSVREYLESSRESVGRPQLFHFQAEKEHHFLFHSCMLYIMHYTLAKSSARLSQDLEAFPLLEYAGSSWFNHCQETDDIGKEIQFLQSDSFVDSLYLIHNPDHPARGPLAKHILRGRTGFYIGATALYYAVSTGLNTVVKRLIKTGIDVNISMPGMLFGNALQAASHHGYGSIVKILIQAGADVNFEGGNHGSALIAAAYRGHNSIARILVEAGAKINTNMYRVLWAAITWGHESTALSMIEASRFAGARYEAYGDMLSTAVDRGLLSVAMMLIDMGADPSILSDEERITLDRVIEEHDGQGSPPNEWEEI